MKKITSKFIKEIGRILLAHPDQRLTSRELAELYCESNPDTCEEKRKNSKKNLTKKGTEVQLASEIAARYKETLALNEKFKTIETYPRKFYYTGKSDAEEVEEVEKIRPATQGSDTGSHSDKPSEEELYPILAEYLYGEKNIFSKRIDERKSKNKQGPKGNKWLYPDIVGLENLSEEWSAEIKETAKLSGDKKIKLWSFEVKKRINRSNVREVFFQAVSNSSWANYGYLVAAEIQGRDTLKEIQMLSSLHGIGFITLDVSSPSDSNISIPAQEKPAIDMDSANRIAKENKDFENYFKLIMEFHQTGTLKPHEWDIPKDKKF